MKYRGSVASLLKDQKGQIIVHHEEFSIGDEVIWTINPAINKTEVGVIINKNDQASEVLGSINYDLLLSNGIGMLAPDYNLKKTGRHFGQIVSIQNMLKAKEDELKNGKTTKTKAEKMAIKSDKAKKLLGLN